MSVSITVIVLGLLVVGIAYVVLKSREMQIWIWSYLGQILRRPFQRKPSVRHVYVCLADHYEPFWGKPGEEKARDRVRAWYEQYRVHASRHADTDGRHPQHSFFYPEEEYREDILNRLKEICEDGFGDVEVYLHHDNDTAEHLRETLLGFTTALHEKHGLLRRDPSTGKIEYAFIHGNWALDNSRPDGRYCGVDNELDVLYQTGCYMDMTMPSAPSATQTSTINSIYFARGRPGRRKSHDKGRPARPGEWAREGEILMVQGPLSLNWKSRKFGILPRIEAGEISRDAPATPERIALWEQCNVHVQGIPEHVFIKLHTHGAEDANIDHFFNGGLDRLWTLLEARFRDRPGYHLHYVSAREMYCKIRDLCMEKKPPRD